MATTMVVKEMANELRQFFLRQTEAWDNVDADDVNELVPHDSKCDKHWPLWLLKLDGEVVGVFDEIHGIAWA